MSDAWKTPKRGLPTDVADLFITHPKSKTFCLISKNLYTLQSGFGRPFRRVQSTPAINQFHCSWDRVCRRSPWTGQVKQPRCRRRWHNQTPLPSQSSNRNRVPRRLRNTKADPSQGGGPGCPDPGRQLIQAGAHVDGFPNQPDLLGADHSALSSSATHAGATSWDNDNSHS